MMLFVLVALSQVETVGLWASLIVGVASVVLAVVAIYFSIEVDRRSASTAAATVGALERIESATRTQSQDTRDLIKVGWERMLGNVAGGAGEPSLAAGASASELAAGIAAELRSQLGLVSDDELEGAEGEPEVGEAETSAERLSEIEQTLRSVQSAVESQLRAGRETPAAEVDRWVGVLMRVSEEARALVRLLNRHITARQWRKLRNVPLFRDAIAELRAVGALVPLEGYMSSGRKGLVYYFPPGTDREIRAAALLLPDPHEEVSQLISEGLREVGWPDTPIDAPD